LYIHLFGEKQIGIEAPGNLSWRRPGSYMHCRTSTDCEIHSQRYGSSNVISVL